MTINVSPKLIHSRRRADVVDFCPVDEAVTTAWLAWKQKDPAALPPQAEDTDTSPDPLLGLWKDYADEMDEIVADAYRQRREESWRELDL